MAKLKKYKSTEKQKWSDLENVFKICAQHIVTIGYHVNNIVTHDDLKPHLAQDPEVPVIVNGVKKDLESFTTELVGIHNKHKDRNGEIKSPDEFFKSLEIYEKYVQFNEKFTGVLIPTMLSLSEKVMGISGKVYEVPDLTLQELLSEEELLETMRKNAEAHNAKAAAGLLQRHEFYITSK